MPILALARTRPMRAVHIYVVLVTVMALAMLFRPARVQIFLTSIGGFVGPILGHFALLDGRVLVAGIVIARHRHDEGIKDLTAARNAVLPREMTVEQPEQLLHLARLRQRISIKPYRLGIRHPVPKAQPQKPPFRDIGSQCPAG